MMNRRRALLFTLALGALVTLAPSALADDWITTGSAVRTKSIGFISVNVYQIDHQVKVAKPARSRQAVIDHPQDKRFKLTFLREVSQEKIRKAFAEALQKNGGGATVGPVSGAFKDDGPDFAKGSHITVTYTVANKTTVIATDSGAKATLTGDDQMKNVWKIWFGNIDQASLPEQLMSQL